MNFELARSYTSLTRAILRFPKAPWNDALSHGQMQSKAWAVDELLKTRRKLGLVYIVGGWLGLLGTLLLLENKFKISKIRSFDIDPECEAIADQINIEYVINDWKYKAVTKDMFDIDYENHSYEIPISGGYFDKKKNNKFIANKPAKLIETPNTIINTSCDHIKDFNKWWDMIPEGKLVLLQNNNFKAGGPDHVNTIESVDQLVVQAPMSRIIFSGERKFAKYDRFMLIGIK